MLTNQGREPYVNPIEWRTTEAHYRRYLDLVHKLEATEEGTDQWYALTDEIRSLPGFPRHFTPTDTLIPVVTDDLH